MISFSRLSVEEALRYGFKPSTKGTIDVAGILFIISAPSGSGKSTLVSELRKQVKDVDFSISWTTRPPRGSEENGREYCFTSEKSSSAWSSEGKFLEHAEVFGDHTTVPRANRLKMRAG